MKNKELSDIQKEFLKLRVIEGKAYDTISSELNIDREELLQWSASLKDEIKELNASAYDSIVEQYELTNVKRLEYLGELYARMKKELDSRDFSGLPTDKLYYVLSDVREKISKQTSGKKGMGYKADSAKDKKK